MIHVILCGGAGTRLWPLSNRTQPKQMLQLFDGKSLLQMAAERNNVFADSIIAVSSVSQSENVRLQLEQVGGGKPVKVLAESVGRNTAAAIALAALAVNYDDILLVTPADHLIGTPALYAESIKKAKKLAEANNLVTFGLHPQYPETGYGYIQFKGEDVVRFAEKPNLQLAENFIAEGDYLWNSGIFCFKAGVVLDEIKTYAPDIYTSSVIAYNDWLKTGDLDRNLMEAIPSNSIDYAVMEKSKCVKVVPSQMDWSDVGSYDALVDALVMHGQHKNDQAVFIQSSADNNIVIGKDKLVALVGVEDLIIVNTPNALLIMKKGHGQDIKQLHQWVNNNRPELL